MTYLNICMVSFVHYKPLWLARFFTLYVYVMFVLIWIRQTIHQQKKKLIKAQSWRPGAPMTTMMMMVP